LKIIPFTKKDMLLLKRSAQYGKPYVFRLALTFLCVLAGIAFDLVTPLFWARIITSLFAKDTHTLAYNLAYIFATYILKVLISFCQGYLFNYINHHIIYDLKKDMYEKILNLPVKAFDEMRVGEFISRMQGDAGSLATIITSQLLSTITDIVRIIVIGVTIISISKPLSLIVIASFPLSFFVFSKFGKKLRVENKEMAGMNDTYFSIMQESIVGIREVKSLGIKQNRFERFLDMTEKLRDKIIRIGIIGSLQGILSQGINFTQQIGVMAAGGYYIFKGLLEMDMFIAFTSYSQQFSSSLMNVTMLNSTIQQVMVSIERIFDLLDNLCYSQEIFGNRKTEQIDGDIKCNNLSFYYREDSYVLDGLSLHIPANKKIAIVGLSGSGKTTIFNLLLRFYNPVSGDILLDDVNISEYDEDSLRRAISIVRQEPFLFHISIKDNLLLANPSASMEDIYEACKLAYIHDYITSLPDGYETVVGEGSTNFSGGQKQRIAIARALLKKSKIILFDEATSSLDNESQYSIKKAIDCLTATHTVVIIAHRLMTIIEADEIIVIDNGKISGAGSHGFLMKNNETYRRLYKTELDILNERQEMTS